MIDDQPTTTNPLIKRGNNGEKVRYIRRTCYQKETFLSPPPPFPDPRKAKNKEGYRWRADFAIQLETRGGGGGRKQNCRRWRRDGYLLNVRTRRIPSVAMPCEATNCTCTPALQRTSWPRNRGIVFSTRSEGKRSRVIIISIRERRVHITCIGSPPLANPIEMARIPPTYQPQLTVISPRTLAYPPIPKCDATNVRGSRIDPESGRRTNRILFASSPRSRRWDDF